MDIQSLLSQLLDHGRPSNERVEALRLLREVIPSHEDRARIVDLLLLDQEPAIRLYAALASATIGDYTTTNILYRMLDSETDSEVEQAVLASLGQLSGKALVPVLIRRIESKDIRRRKGAVFVAAKILDPRTMDVMLKVVKHDADSHMRFLAAIALARWGRKEGVDVLVARIRGISYVDDTVAACALSLVGEKTGYDALSNLLARVNSLTPNELCIVTQLLRETLGIAGEEDEALLATARKWVASKLTV